MVLPVFSSCLCSTLCDIILGGGRIWGAPKGKGVIPVPASKASWDWILLAVGTYTYEGTVQDWAATRRARLKLRNPV